MVGGGGEGGLGSGWGVWVLADRIANAWQSQFILLTIRSNLFHAKSSLRFREVLFDTNRGGCGCHHPLGDTLHYYYTQLTDLHCTVPVMLHLNPCRTPQWNICLWLRWDSHAKFCCGENFVTCCYKQFGKLVRIAVSNKVLISVGSVVT